MIINFSVLANTNQPDQFENLRLAIPNNFSKLEVNETINFLKDYINQKYGLVIHPTHSKTPITTNKTKKITLRHFYNYLSVVKIRNGIRDDELDFDLSGLRGQILLFFQDDTNEVYFIQWTRDSFLQIPDEYLLRLMENDLPWSGTYIESSNILPIQSAHSLELLDLVLLNKYIKMLSQPARDYWKNQVLPLVEFHQNVFLAWEKLFSGNKHPLYFSYRMNNIDGSEVSTKCFLSPAGFDSIIGVWVVLSDQEKEIIIPLSQITRFEDPILDQKLRLYQGWVRNLLP